MKDYWYEIEPEMRDNWLALFKEILINGENGIRNLYCWYLEEMPLIEQSISELEMLDEIREEVNCE